MASLTGRHPLVRARVTKAESQRLREETGEVRRAARETCRIGRAVTRQLDANLAHRHRAAQALGAWPYWAPPTRDLLTVLVVASDS